MPQPIRGIDACPRGGLNNQYSSGPIFNPLSPHTQNRRCRRGLGVAAAGGVGGEQAVPQGGGAPGHRDGTCRAASSGFWNRSTPADPGSTRCAQRLLKSAICCAHNKQEEVELARVGDGVSQLKQVRAQSIKEQGARGQARGSGWYSRRCLALGSTSPNQPRNPIDVSAAH